MSDPAIISSRALADVMFTLEMGLEPNPNRTNQTRTLIFERTEQN